MKRNLPPWGAGVVAAMALLYREIDLTLTLNGAIGGLVAITAGPDLQNHPIAVVVGGIGGVLVVFAVPLLDRLGIDEEGERVGLDQVDLGIEAYAEFGKGSQSIA